MSDHEIDRSDEADAPAPTAKTVKLCSEEVLATLDHRPLSVRIDEAEERVAQAQAKLDEARSEFNLRRLCLAKAQGDLSILTGKTF